MLNTIIDLAQTDGLSLSDLSPSDKPWDIHAAERDKVRNLYLELGHPYALRLSECSQWLDFALFSQNKDEIAYALQNAKFCRVRHCPVCQWRRSLKWRAKFFQVLPKIIDEYPTSRYIFLTLTVKNCEVDVLKNTIQEMNKAWHKLIKRKSFPALGWMRSLEVTKSKIDSSAHPHFHILLMVPANYFNSSGSYLNQSEWSDLWKSSLKVNYNPIVNVKCVKTKVSSINDHDLLASICETLKYSVKPADLFSESSWLLKLTNQLYKVRSIAAGGVFKNFLSALDEDSEDLIHINESEKDSDSSKLRFNWKYQEKKYMI